jgi:hypothetical protein
VTFKSISEIQTLIRKKDSRKAGEDGEKYATKWMTDAGWKFEPVEQGKYDISQRLREYGGKRPDFIMEPNANDGIVVVDAKYHSTDDCKCWRIRDEEIGKYRGLKRFLEDEFPGNEVDVLFAVLPKECDGKRIVWIGLDELDNGTAITFMDEPAIEISLIDREELWFDNNLDGI